MTRNGGGRTPIRLRISTHGSKTIAYDIDDKVIPDITDIHIHCEANKNTIGYYLQWIRDEEGNYITSRRSKKRRKVYFYVQEFI